MKQIIESTYYYQNNISYITLLLHVKLLDEVNIKRVANVRYLVDHISIESPYHDCSKCCLLKKAIAPYQKLEIKKIGGMQKATKGFIERNFYIEDNKIIIPYPEDGKCRQNCVNS